MLVLPQYNEYIITAVMFMYRIMRSFDMTDKKVGPKSCIIDGYIGHAKDENSKDKKLTFFSTTFIKGALVDAKRANKLEGNCYRDIQ